MTRKQSNPLPLLIFGNHHYYLSHIPQIVTVQSLARRWLVRRRIIKVNEQFASLVEAMNPGCQITWLSDMAFDVRLVPTLRTSVGSNPPKSSKFVDVSVQCSRAETVDEILQTSIRDLKDEEIQCVIAETGDNTGLSEAFTQTPKAHAKYIVHVEQKSARKDLDRLIELHNCDFSQWTKADLERTRTELLMELCWTDQAIESRKEFLAFTKKSSISHLVVSSS